jgi:multiple sugar transport system substrate-binding protein
MRRRRFVMRRRTTRFSALAVSALLVGLSTAGCGGGSSGPCGEAGAEPTASVAGHQPVTLCMWSGFNKPEFDYLNSAIAMFEKKYPWIHVNTVPGKEDTDVLNAIHGGNAPDAVMLTIPDDGVQFCGSDAYINLKPYLQADHVDLNSLVPQAALGYTAYAEKSSQCMLPMLTDAYGLYYNTDMFRKAGISNPPKTYSEFFADVKKLTQLNSDGTIKVAGFLPLATGDYELANVVNGVQEGADWYDSSGHNLLGTDPRFAEMLAFYKSMADWFGYKKLNGWFHGNGGENTEFSASNLFENQKLAMVADGEWRVNFIENVDHSKVPYATAPYPVPDNAAGRYGVAQTGGSTLGVTRNSEHPKESWMLVKYLALDTGAETFLARKLLNVPTVKAALKDPVLNNNENFAVFMKAFADPNSRYKQITKLGFGDVDLYDPFVDKYLAGKVPDLKAGLQGVATQIDNQLKLGT